MLLSMQDRILSSALRICDRKAAAALTDPFRRRILLMFAGKECGVGEMAEKTGTEIKRLHYHVNALAKLGLLEVVGSRRRDGRSIKLYRAVAPAFFVPVEIAPESASIALTRQLQESLVAARAGGDEGMLYHIDESGKPRMRLLLTSGSQRGAVPAEVWRVLALSQKDAQHLLREVTAVVQKYTDRRGGSWLVHFAAAPTKFPTVRVFD